MFSGRKWKQIYYRHTISYPINTLGTRHFQNDRMGIHCLFSRGEKCKRIYLKYLFLTILLQPRHSTNGDCVALPIICSICKYNPLDSPEVCKSPVCSSSATTNDNTSAMYKVGNWVMDIMVEINLMNLVQILVCVWLFTNVIEKGMNPSLLPSTIVNSRARWVF